MAARRLAVTLGDPRGIGVEVARKAATRFRRECPECRLTFLGHQSAQVERGSLEAVGRWDGTESSAGQIAAEALRRGVQEALSGSVDALVTAPVHKPALHRAGWRVPGQTEMLQQLAGAPAVGMLMAAERTRLDGPLRVLLATTHVALRDVPDRLTPALLETQTRLLDEALRSGWAIHRPRLALCALNPHASDEGLFGDEEERIYGPVLERLRESGLDVVGPVPADTVFCRAVEGSFDAVVAPYHDVGMAAFKTVTFGTGVNVTLGLPFVRTSPDHGTAFDLAGRGIADPSSMLEALRLAYRIVRTRTEDTTAEPVPT